MSLLASTLAGAQDVVWTNFTGQPGGAGSSDGAGTNARFRFPQDVSLDNSGNVYVADSGNLKVRKITPDGIVTTLAGSGKYGSISEFTNNDGVGTNASFVNPASVAVSRKGGLYVSDGTNSAIRFISTNTAVTTIAGGYFGSADGTGTNAQFEIPINLATDTNGNAYAADLYNNTIRKITQQGVVTTVAGKAGVSGTNNGIGTNALFIRPQGVAVDASGNIYVSELLGGLRKITPSNFVTRISANIGTFPRGLAVSAAGNIYAACSSVINTISPSGVVQTLAGRKGKQGGIDGIGTNALFRGPTGVAIDSATNAYVADRENHAIRKISPAGVVTTFAGCMTQQGNTDGPPSSATFDSPRGICSDCSGNVFVADYNNNSVRKVTPNGYVSTFAGSPSSSGGYLDGNGTNARFSQPMDAAVDSLGNLFVADQSNHVIRKISPSGVVTTFAGNANQSGSNDGMGTNARFNYPSGIATDLENNLYIADYYNNAIRKITPDGLVTTLAGLAGASGSVDGTGTNARFNQPRGITVDQKGDIFVIDGSLHIRKVTSGGEVTSLLTSASVAGVADVPSASGITSDFKGNLYVACGNVVQVIDKNLNVTLIGGSLTEKGSTPYGTNSAFLFSWASDVAVAPNGSIYVTDTDNNRVAVGIAAAKAQLSCARGSIPIYNEQVSTIEISNSLSPETFTVSNLGKNTLTISSVVTSPSGLFQLVQYPFTSVPAGQSTTFSLRALEGPQIGVMHGTVTIYSNDPDQPAFTFPLNSRTLVPVGPSGAVEGSTVNVGTVAGWDIAQTDLPSGAIGPAARTGVTPTGGQSTLGASFGGPGLLSWSWKVSAVQGSDWLVCEVDGEEVAGISQANGVWQTQVASIPASASVRWIYRKNAAAQSGDEAGYIANTTFEKFTNTQVSFADWSASHGILDPAQRIANSSLPSLVAWAGGINPSTELPTSFYRATMENGQLTYRYSVSKLANATLTPQFSSNLSDWSSRTLQQSVVEEKNDSFSIKVSAPSSGGHGFIRLEAIKP